MLDVIQALQASHDSGFTKELVQILAEQRSTDVQKAVLALFQDQKVKDGEESAKAILGGWQDAPVGPSHFFHPVPGGDRQPPVLPAALAPLVDSADNCGCLGRHPGAGQGGRRRLGHPAGGEAEEPGLSRMRGSRRSCWRSAPSRTRAPWTPCWPLQSNTDEDKVRRMYAADSLGKIGDARALPVLKAMFQEKDALIRLYAASALAQFSLDDALPFLIQGLRDENWKVREQSAKALARRLPPAQAGSAVPILVYKAQYDPVSQVRVASVQALGAIGGDGVMRQLADLYGGSDKPLDSREAALGVLVDKALPQSVGAIRKVLGEEWTSFDTADPGVDGTGHFSGERLGAAGVLRAGSWRARTRWCGPTA